MQIKLRLQRSVTKLNAAGVRYLIVGGYAVMVHTEPRYTKDLDIWIEAKRNDAQLFLSALQAFGAPISQVTADDFTEPKVFFQIGVDPVRGDIMTFGSGPGIRSCLGS